MFQISGNNIISINRGDSICIPLFINVGTKLRPVRYNLNKRSDFVIYFGVMECHQRFEDAIIRKRWDKNDAVINQCGDLIIQLSPEETELLDPGKYYYQAKIVIGAAPNEVVNTLTPLTEFWILE